MILDLEYLFVIISYLFSIIEVLIPKQYTWHFLIYKVIFSIILWTEITPEQAIAVALLTWDYSWLNIHFLCACGKVILIIQIELENPIWPLVKDSQGILYPFLLIDSSDGCCLVHLHLCHREYLLFFVFPEPKSNFYTFSVFSK